MHRKFRATFEQELRKRLNNIQLDSAEWTRIPCLGEFISDFVLTGGKRIRPTLFLLAYYGYAKNPNPEIFKVATALELLHSFALIHDDIIDDSPTRRGYDSMHIRFSKIFNDPAGNQPSGKALALLAGDLLYTIALETFVSMNGDPARKEKALRELLTTARMTGSGAFLELYSRRGKEEKISQDLIFQIYNLKTVGYTFACPLKLAAIFAEVPEAEIQVLDDFAKCLGYAYQIKDDIDDLKLLIESHPDLLPMRAEEIRLMLPVWYLYTKASTANRLWLEKLEDPGLEDLSRLKRLLNLTGAFELASEELNKFIEKAYGIVQNLRLNKASRGEILACLGLFFGRETRNFQEAEP